MLEVEFYRLYNGHQARDLCHFTKVGRVICRVLYCPYSNPMSTITAIKQTM